MKNVVIIGAGPAGLTAAYYLLKYKVFHPIIVEASGQIGGISRTDLYKGNRIDIGGHRFFSKDEEISIVNKLLKTADSNPYHLAVLLEIFTGLSVNEISALKKNSLVKLQSSKGYYLSVHETYKKENGKDLLTVHRKREKHRKIPVISLVSRFFENLDNSDSEYLLTHPDTNEPLRPWKIYDTIKDLFREEINIEKDLIYLPIRDGNWKKTDLNKYYGDFLRTNFRFRLLNECMMEVM